MYKPYKDLLTIGITAFNEEKYIRETLESCVNQAGEIIICDNASTDTTQLICEEMARKYPNISYHRLEKDLGKDYGYNFPVERCKTKYFMWCGPHDILSKEYTSNLIYMLENSNAVGCYPKGKSIEVNGNFMAHYDYWYSQDLINDSGAVRVYSLIRNLHNLCMLYGIFRADLVKKYKMPPGIGADHVFLCNMASEGKLIYCPDSVFGYRETKLGFKHDDVIKSWNDAKMSTQRANTYDFMINEQLNALKRCKARGIIEWVNKLNLIRKAKKKLRKRFGN